MNTFYRAEHKRINGENDLRLAVTLFVVMDPSQQIRSGVFRLMLNHQNQPEEAAVSKLSVQSVSSPSGNRQRVKQKCVIVCLPVAVD